MAKIANFIITTASAFAVALLVGSLFGSFAGAVYFAFKAVADI
jgi:hypothetical protein